ncbi:MAG: 5-(carboxyamino)imidazole ribonucleotide synthase [Pseudobdellovibrionaceae bacterium]
MKSPRRKIGFLGGGQLARMMILEAHRMGLEPHVFTADPKDPAAQVTSHCTVGKLYDIKALEQFAQKMDLLTFESEFAPPETLAALEKQPAHKVFPKPEIMRRLQNRISQKQTLEQFKIPTASFLAVSNAQELHEAWTRLDGSFVLKKNFGGYDGYGTFFAHKKSDLKDLEGKLKTESQGFLGEKMISFKRELAAIFIRNSSGKTTCLPLVETHQTGGRCDWVRGPLTHRQWPELQKKIFKMMKGLDYVGALGVEMFDTGSTLLVNELAPRVHNSGHYSQDALIESQFSLHLKAGLGEDLNPPLTLAPQFVMTNLLGESQSELNPPAQLKGTLHLYGKTENRPGRKMGHVNYLGAKGPALLNMALKERKKFQL